MADLFDGYPLGQQWDEMFSVPGQPRPPYTGLFGSLQPMSGEELAARADVLSQTYRDAGVTFAHAGEEQPFPLDMIAGVDRLAGFQAGLAAAGLPARPELVAEGDFTEAGGTRAMAELLARVPDLDAVFVASDPMAVGALRALRAAGRRVPEDVAVVGFDDAAVAQSCDPPLTTIAQPLTDMTPLLTELLLRQIEGIGEAAESRVCRTQLVRRASA